MAPETVVVAPIVAVVPIVVRALETAVPERAIVEEAATHPEVPVAEHLAAAVADPPPGQAVPVALPAWVAQAVAVAVDPAAVGVVDAKT